MLRGSELRIRNMLKNHYESAEPKCAPPLLDGSVNPFSNHGRTYN